MVFEWKKNGMVTPAAAGFHNVLNKCFPRGMQEAIILIKWYPKGPIGRSEMSPCLQHVTIASLLKRAFVYSISKSQ